MVSALARRLGVLAPDASPALCEEYTRRAGLAAAYREAAGITDPEQIVSPQAHRSQPELEAMRKAVFSALEMRDEAEFIRGLDRGELEAQVLEGERAHAATPPDVSSQLPLTAQAEADAWRESADAEAAHDNVWADNARSLAATMAAEAIRLETATARYEEWSALTASTREIAGKANAELQRRGQQPSAAGEPASQDTTASWRELLPDVNNVDQAIEREHQAAVYVGPTRPSEGQPETVHEKPDAAAPGRQLQPERSRPGVSDAQTDAEPDVSKPETPHPEAAQSERSDEARAERLDELQARAEEAARRIDAQRAELDASSEHTARIQREVQAEQEAGRQAEATNEMEMEL